MALLNKFRTNLSADMISCLLLIAMVLWFCHEMVWSNKVPFFRDLATQHYPNRFLLAQSFQDGEIPLWNRQLSMGVPFLANLQSGAFYPPHLVFLIMPFFDAIRFLFVLHYLIAASGSYLLCRQWNYPPYLALVGALLFAFGGIIVSLTNMLDYFQTAVWLPWVLIWGERIISGQSWKNFFVLVIVLLTQFLAGHPETYAVSLVILFLDGLRVKAQLRGLTYRKFLSLFFAANALVVGLAMVQILPAAELFEQSSRSAIMPYEKAAARSFNPLGLVNLFFLDKEVDLNAHSGWNLFFAAEPSLIMSLYVGAAGLVGVCLWFLTSSRKEMAVLLGLAACFLTVAMGTYTLVYSFVFDYFPVLGLFRYPEKFLFPFSVILLFIALRGISAFLHSQASDTRRLLPALALIPLLLCCLYLFLRVERETLIHFISSSRGISVLHPSTLDSFSAVLFHLERQVVLIVLMLLLLFLWKRGKLGTQLFQILLVGLVYFDLASAHKPYHLFLDADLVYRAPRIVTSSTLEPYRLFYAFRLSDLHPNTYAFYRKPFDSKTASTFSTLIPNTGVFHGFDYMQELESLKRKRYDLFLDFANKLPPERLYRLLAALNVKYMNSFRELPEGDITLVKRFREHPAWLYRLDSAVPRVYIVPRVSYESEPLRALERLSSGQFRPFEEVLVDKPLSIIEREDFQGRAAFLSYKNNQVTIHSSLNSPGVLVLTDSYYPGWRVYVNGNESEIFRANLFFRGVLLPEGEHVVEFRYRPLSFLIGLAVSLMTLCGILIAVIAHPLRR